MERITSRSNPLCAYLRKLAASAAFRRERGEFLCDSPKILEEALTGGADVRTVVVSSDASLPALPSGIRALEVPPELMSYLSPAKTPQGVLCVCGIPERDLPRRLDGSRYVVLDGVQDPGNVGTILRSADAFGADGVLLTGSCADPYGPKTVRATMGAVFRLEVWTCGAEELGALLRASGIPLYGAALRADTEDARAVDYSRCAIAIGSEGSGLSEKILSLCDRTVRIPMRERCESLNAAQAAAVLLWEAARTEL